MKLLKDENRGDKMILALNRAIETGNLEKYRELKEEWGVMELWEIDDEKQENLVDNYT